MLLLNKSKLALFQSLHEKYLSFLTKDLFSHYRINFKHSNDIQSIGVIIVHNIV